MPSRWDHAWRASSISPRCASTSGVDAHSALTKVLMTSRTSFDDSRFNSGGSTLAFLHHAGGAAEAGRELTSDSAPLMMAMTSLFIRSFQFPIQEPESAFCD